ncbi:hypothetical protein HW560_08380 [Paenibacillus sp. E222]|uniref:hypothetical protein n=1 Tax=Paenibacillus sp. E222 TaxID=2748863 RepID=UPI0015C5D1A8|nr:hypothetical protein [Paenibacillus sp. E222]QLG38133.1 hypothetical protein HW560_08380 [Paenibacillus sp. E222]
MISRAKDLIPVVEEIIQLKQVCDQAARALEEHYGHLSSIEKFEKYVEDEHSQHARSNIEDYLEILSKYDIAIIQSIMYSGRDHHRSVSIEHENNVEQTESYDENDGYTPRDSFIAYYNSVKNDNKNGAIQHLLGKGQLTQYLINGIQIIRTM